MIIIHLLLLLWWMGRENSVHGCIHTQSYWLSNASVPWPSNPPLNQPLCGLSWSALMHLNASQVRDTASLRWLLAFHQLCTATLNLQTQSDTTSSLPSSVALSITVVFDSMQRQCDNLASWATASIQDGVLAGHLLTLMTYNHGSTPCKPPNALPFSFTQSPQLFFLDYNETHEDQAELVAHTYRIQTFLIIFSVFTAFLVIPGLILYIIMLRNRKRDYSCFSIADLSHTLDASGTDVHSFSGEEEYEFTVPVKEKEM